MAEIEAGQRLAENPCFVGRTQCAQHSPVLFQRIINIPDGIILKGREAVVVGVPAHIAAKFLIGPAYNAGAALQAASVVMHDF